MEMIFALLIVCFLLGAFSTAIVWWVKGDDE